MVLEESQLFQANAAPEVVGQGAIHGINVKQLSEKPERMKRFMKFPDPHEWPELRTRLIAAMRCIARMASGGHGNINNHEKQFY
jgi:hypothetical protein